MRQTPGILLALTLGLLVVVACSTPEPKPDFESDAAAERILALEQSIRDPRPEDVPHLIELLDSTDPAVRMIAIQHLRDVTGENFGFDHAAHPLEREAAIERWMQWLDERPTTHVTSENPRLQS